MCQEKEEEEGEEGEGNNKEQTRKENVPMEAVNGQVKSRVAAVESAGGNKGTAVGSPEFSPARGSVASGGQSRHGGLKHSDSRWPSTSTQRDFPN